MKYYFLATYLPELQRDDKKVRVSLAELLGEPQAYAREDWADIELVLLAGDIFVLERLLTGKPAEVEHTLYGVEFWREQIKSPKEGPAFLVTFLEQLEPGRLASPKVVEDLYSAYFNHAMATARNGLLRNYLAFERDLRNILAALRAREKNLVVTDHLVGEGELIENIARSRAEDFGLGGDYPFMEKLLAAKDPQQMQDAHEQILWNFLDEEAGQDPFAFDALLAYLLRLTMLEKRLALNEDEAMARVRRWEAL